MGYPSLQGDWEFERVEDVVPVLDVMVLRLRLTELAQRKAIADLKRLRVRKGSRLVRDRILIDLECEADKTADILSVYGFSD